MISTTSPSYPLLLTIEKNIRYLNSSRGKKELNNLIEAPIKKGDTMGTITYTADKFSYSVDLIADHDVEKFEISTVLWQIILSVVVLLVLSKLIFGKKKVSRKKTSNYSNKSKKKNRKKYNTKKNYDSIYKF